MKNKRIVVAIDGQSGCGKTTTASAVAKKLKYLCIDTGAMYRAVTIYAMDNKLSAKDISGELYKIKITYEFETQGRVTMYLNGKNVEDKIRSPEVTKSVSEISAIAEVREFLVQEQRNISVKGKNIIMEGRDIGTVVFPDATIKLFMIGDLKVRAERRKIEMLARGINVSIEKNDGVSQKKEIIMILLGLYHLLEKQKTL